MSQDKCNCEYWRGMAMEALTRSAAISFVCPEHGAATIDIRPVRVVNNHPYVPPPQQRDQGVMWR